MKKILPLFICIVLFSQCKTEQIATINCNTNNEIIGFAKAELIKFGEEGHVLSFGSSKRKAKWSFNLLVDSSMSVYSFSVEDKIVNGVKHIYLRGADATSVLHAVYTFLEKAGWTFEITGPKLTQGVPQYERSINYEEKIDPVVKKRGIRQHINFPMDISSYSISDAKEYIYNLARMRFNFITFHSYPGQWYEVLNADKIEYAGNFFYGDRHDIPDNPLIKEYVKNEKVYCIPEIEPYFEDKAKRSQMAIQWLQNVILEAKNCGFSVELSVEPRQTGEDFSYSKEIVYSILKDYPMIDALEFMTEENGGWSQDQCSKKDMIKTITTHFGTMALNDTLVAASLNKTKKDLQKLIGDIGHNISLLKIIKEEGIPNLPELKIGIYSSFADFTRIAYHLARKYAPETEIALLSGHHSRNVSVNAPQVLAGTNDWDKTMIYSWIEFDGMMYLQQHGIKGIHDIVYKASQNSTKGKVNAILFNHWRTAENHITARYAALSSLFGDIPPSEFYKDYASRLGIANNESFSKAMELLDDEEWNTTINYGNLGFCWVGWWRKGGNFGHGKAENYNSDIENYENIRECLKECFAETHTEEGKYTLAFLDNRLCCTILYLKAFSKATELKKYEDALQNGLTEKEKKNYADICNQALLIMDQYLKIHAKMMPDRGTEGTLVNIYVSPIKGLKMLREKHGGIAFEEEPHTDQPVDEPPLPFPI